jgi:TonB dependent receptor
MSRFYRAAVIVALLGHAVPARAQDPTTPPPTSQERPPLGASITVGALGELPSSANLFSLLDTVVPDVIADRIDTGGLSAGAAARVGAHGSTWTQTIFRVGDADITSPTGTGVPLLIPGVKQWDRVEVATGLMPIDINAPGMAVSLVPRDPRRTSFRSIEFLGSPPLLNADRAPGAQPAITQLNSWAHTDLFLSGTPSPQRLSALLSASWTRSSRFERGRPTVIDGNLASAFLNIVSTPTSADLIRVIGWGQRARDAAPHHIAFDQPSAGEQDTGVHGQAGWQHRAASDANVGVRTFASYTLGRRATDVVAPAVIVVERLTEGPIPELLAPGIGTDRVWMVGAHVDAAAAGHQFLAGGDLTGASATAQSTFSGRVGELINGAPARVWDFIDPPQLSDWRSSTLSLFAADSIAIAPGLTINGGLRFERITGSAAPGTTAIAWQNILPQAGVHWAVTKFWQLSTFAQYSRYGHRLPLRDLAYGDPTAPTASMYRWNATTAGPPQANAIGPLVQRWGPGSGGVAGFSTIDPALKRPVMEEAVLGFEARPHPSAFVRLAAIGRRESNLIGVVDVGVPESTYSTIGVPDMGIDVIGAQDDQILLFYNRAPSTFGADRYLLTNPADDEATFVGAEMVGQVRANRLSFIAGVTAGRSEGLSANRGFAAIENDAAVLGEVYINPNARGHAQGRVFTERGYTIKTAMSYQFPHDTTFGLIGRYQDGQHFARLVLLPSLNQGIEAVRAFRNGRTRFTFSMTVDARLQKVFGRLTAILDAYNLFNQALEIEEFSVTGASSRLTSAVQPPRVIQLGIRIPF